MTARPRLTPAMADTRRAVRVLLREVFPEALEAMTTMPGCAGGTGYDVPVDAPLVLVALSGGADSLALAAATAFEAQRCGLRAGAIVVDHGLQAGSSEVAARAAEQARTLGLTPVVLERVAVVGKVVEPVETTSPDFDKLNRLVSRGPEANARAARYAAFETALGAQNADAVLLAHTLDDQAETVLLGLTRGAGGSSLAGMEPVNGVYLRPFLGIRREQTVAACADQGLEAWSDPQNLDTAFTRVRIRTDVLPVLEAQLGPGVAEALARTAEHLQDDAEVLEAIADNVFSNTAIIALQGMTSLEASVEDLPRAIRVRVYQRAAAATGSGPLTSAHLRGIDDLVMNWHGQAGVDVPGGRVVRENGILRFEL